MFRSVSKLSQAAAHPRRGTNKTRNGIFPAMIERHATQPEQKKQRRKACLISKIYMQEMMQACIHRLHRFIESIGVIRRANLCNPWNKKGRVPTTLPFSGRGNVLGLVGFLADESRHVEIVNTCCAHHWPWEIIGRSGYETWRRRGNRRGRGGRRY
jgi:hypothetical protein